MSRTPLFTATLAFSIIAGASSGAAAASCSPIQDENPCTMWAGIMHIFKVTGTCTLDKLRAYKSVYRPTTGTTPAFTLYFRADKVYLMTNSNAVQFDGAGTLDMAYITASAYAGSTSSNSYAFTQRPANVTKQTRFVSLNGHIDNFANTGCTVYLRGAYVRTLSWVGPLL